MTIGELVEALFAGLNRTFITNFAHGDDPTAKIRPEYLSTVLIASALAEQYCGTSTQAEVRMEVPTTKVLGTSIVFPRHKGWRNVITREGKVDVVMCAKKSGTARPIVLVEAKRYAVGYSTIADDIKRLAEFLMADNKNGEGTVAIGTSTFFWREARSTTKNGQHGKFLKSFKKIEMKVKKNVPADLDVEVFYRCLFTSAYETHEEAYATNADGQPNCEAEEPISIFSGIVILRRKKREEWLDKLKKV